MKFCNVWLNGRNVGTLKIRDVDRRAIIQCNLQDGWIYRAKLFADKEESIHLGVLVPEKGIFATTAVLPLKYITANHLHCEILRTIPGKTNVGKSWLTFWQSEIWKESALPLDQSLLDFVQKIKGMRYCIYCKRRYLLFPIVLNEVDPVAALYTVGKPIYWPEGWFLCVEVDETGRTIFMSTDEK